MPEFPEIRIPPPSHDEIRQTLLWLAQHYERLTTVYRPGEILCQSCGHSLAAHIVQDDEDADNPLPWPCRYPKLLGAPVGLCRCGDYTAVRE